MKGIYLPVAAAQEPRLVEVNDAYGDLRKMVEGAVERTQYDLDAAIWVNGSGAINGLPRNERATDYVLNHSYSARQWHAQGMGDDGYALYGPAVILGSDPHGNFETDVPDRLIQHFGVEPQLAKQPGTDQASEPGLWKVGYATTDSIEASAPMPYDQALRSLATKFGHDVVSGGPESVDALSALELLRESQHGDAFKMTAGDRTYFLVPEGEEVRHQGFGYEV